MKKFFNAAREKAKTIWAYLKGLVRKPDGEHSVETAEAEPSVVEDVAAVIGMCALVGVVTFGAGHIVVYLDRALRGVGVALVDLAYLFGKLPYGQKCAIVSVFDSFGVCLLDYMQGGSAFAAGVATGAYISYIVMTAHDNGCKVSDCARRGLNRVANYCKNHPCKALWFVLAALVCCVPGVMFGLQVGWHKALCAIVATHGAIVGFGLNGVIMLAEVVMLIAALVCIYM